MRRSPSSVLPESTPTSPSTKPQSRTRHHHFCRSSTFTANPSTVFPSSVMSFVALPSRNPTRFAGPRVGPEGGSPQRNANCGQPAAAACRHSGRHQSPSALSRLSLRPFATRNEHSRRLGSHWEARRRRLCSANSISGYGRGGGVTASAALGSRDWPRQLPEAA